MDAPATRTTSVGDGVRRRSLIGFLVAPLFGRALALPSDLLDRFPELAAVRWRRGGLPPRVGGWALLQPSAAAITLWRTVFLAPETRLDPELLLHEFRHVQQFGRSVWFPVRYLWGSIRLGYHRNPYELDADQFAAQRLAGARAAEAGRPPHAVPPTVSPSPGT
jgi:Domain of unknown function (DUF4157)